MQEPFEFGLFWDDFQWFDITENGTPASEVLKKYPGNLWFAKNDDELRFYSDAARTNCLAQFRRLQVVINFKLFDDGKSIFEAQAEVEL